MVTGEETTTRSMVYVIKGKVCLMSKTTLMALGCLPKEFPQIGKFLGTETRLVSKEARQALGIINNAIGSHKTAESDNLSANHGSHPEAVRQPLGECDSDSPLPCSCARRQFTNPPDSLPMPATASNREELRVRSMSAKGKVGQSQRDLL